MLAGVESMLRHQDILQGCHFTWVTDHKGLIHLVNQRNLSGRQARWIEKISSFDFEIQYVPSTENVLAEALSRIYSNEAPSTVRTRSEYTYFDVVDNDVLHLASISMPVFSGGKAAALANDRVTRSMTREWLGKTPQRNSREKGGEIDPPSSSGVENKVDSSISNVNKSINGTEGTQYALRPRDKAQEGGNTHQDSENTRLPLVPSMELDNTPL
jgi:hypothetical protein